MKEKFLIDAMSKQEIYKVFKLVGTGLVNLKNCHKLWCFKKLLLMIYLKKRINEKK